jgi:hypothetical protein
LHHGSHTTDFILTDRRTHVKIQLQQYILNTVIKEIIKVPKIYETLQILGTRREIQDELQAEDPQVFQTADTNLVARMTWRPGFVYSSTK